MSQKIYKRLRKEIKREFDRREYNEKKPWYCPGFVWQWFLNRLFDFEKK